MLKDKKKVKILIANGPNLDLLGIREPDIYGNMTLIDIEKALKKFCDRLKSVFSGLDPELVFFQTNDEAIMLKEISKNWDGAVINPAAWTHTSLALADRLAALRLPFVEVHISNLANREDFRKRSFTATHALGVCYGMGVDSYLSGLTGILRYLERDESI